VLSSTSVGAGGEPAFPLLTLPVSLLATLAVGFDVVASFGAFAGATFARGLIDTSALGLFGTGAEGLIAGTFGLVAGGSFWIELLVLLNRGLPALGPPGAAGIGPTLAAGFRAMGLRAAIGGELVFAAA